MHFDPPPTPPACAKCFGQIARVKLSWQLMQVKLLTKH